MLTHVHQVHTQPVYHTKCHKCKTGQYRETGQEKFASQKDRRTDGQMDRQNGMLELPHLGFRPAATNKTSVSTSIPVTACTL